MKSYIALLRGINVSGQKLIKMAELRLALEKAGFENLNTYIQSGNIVFQSEVSKTEDLALRIKAVILEKFGFDVSTQVLLKDELESIIAGNPFKEEVVSEPNRVLLVRLGESPDASNLKIFLEEDLSPDRVVVKGNWVYIHFPEGQAKSKLSNNLIEKRLKVSATGRNWNTVLKLSKMLDELPAN